MTTPRVSEGPRWYVISLRPRGEHAALRRAASRHGAGLIALSPWRLQTRDSEDSRAALREALGADCIVVTSPAAVRAAMQLRVLRPRRGQHWCAVGAGTAAALRRAGIGEVLAPSRMDSEGLLALPALQQLDGERVGLLTAPGGRGALVPALQARGAQVLRADVYERVSIPLSPTALASLNATTAPLSLALSSGEALQRVLDALPDDLRGRVRQARVLAASERLATLARAHGFVDIAVARGPRPAQLLAVAEHG